jgi:hypothetical protein
MNEQKNDKWLDKLISRTINTEKPEFDAEKWKQKYPDEYQALLTRSGKISAHPVRWVSLLGSSIVKFAAAAVIIIVIGFFMIRPADKEDEITETANANESSAEMLTLRSLKIAYHNGGIEAVENQCDKAIEKIGKRPERITFQELLEDIDGV